MFQIFHCFFSSTWTAFLLCFLSDFAHMLKITVFVHWQCSGLCKCLDSSWIIPTEFRSCPVMCRRVWFGCMSRNFFAIAMVDIVNTHTKVGITSCVECICLCKAYCSRRKFYPEPWQCMLGLLPEVWSFLFLLCFYLTIIIAGFAIYVILVWVPVSFPSVVPVCSASTY